jgi:THO complex subunit 4
MTYNKDGRSLGVATIIFSKPDAAVKAAKDLNGMLVDKRPMKASLNPPAGQRPYLTSLDRSCVGCKQCTSATSC